MVDEDTVLVPADGEMIMAAKVLDKCDEGGNSGAYTRCCSAQQTFARQIA